MADFYYLNNYQERGKMGISRRAFETIATIASNNLQSVKVKGYGKEDVIARLNTIFSFPARPCQAFFKKNGRVDLAVQIEIGNNIKDITNVCTRLQEEVATNVSMMCETVPVQVEVNVSREKPIKPAKPKKPVKSRKKEKPSKQKDNN